MEADTGPFGSEDGTPGLVLLSCACPAWPGRAGRPPGPFRCTSPFPVAGLGAFFVCSATSGPGFSLFVVAVVLFFSRSFLWCAPLSLDFCVFRPGAPLALTSCGLPARHPSFAFFLLCLPPLSLAIPVLRPGPPWALASSGPSARPPALLFFFFFNSAPPLSPAFRVFRPGLLWALASCGSPARAPFLLFLVFFVRPRCLWRSVFSGPECLRPWRLVVLPSAPRLFFFPFSPPPPCPPPFFLLAELLFFVCPLFVSASGFFFLAVVCRLCGPGAGLCVLGCGVCWCLLLWALCPGTGRFALALCRSMLPGCACSLCVVACRVVRVRWCRAGGVSLPCEASGALLLCFVLWSCSAALVACRCFWVLWLHWSVAPGLVVLFRLALMCVVLGAWVFCFASFWGALWCCPPPPPASPRVLCAVVVFLGCVLVVLPPPPPPPGWLWCAVLCAVVRRVVWCGGLWRVLCFARCFLACLCWAGFCAVACSPVVARACVLFWGAVLLCSGVPPVVRCAGVCVMSCWWCPDVWSVLAGAVFCCLWMSGARCLVWLPAFVFLLACVVAAGPAWSRGLLPCCVLWFVFLPHSPVLCPVFCGASLPCGAVLWCPAVSYSFRVVFVGVFSLCLRCGVVLLIVSFVAVLICADVGASCCGVSLCVVVSPLAFCAVVVLPWCVVLSGCALQCSVVLCPLVVPCCWAVLCVLFFCGWSFTL